MDLKNYDEIRKNLEEEVDTNNKRIGSLKGKINNYKNSWSLINKFAKPIINFIVTVIPSGVLALMLALNGFSFGAIYGSYIGIPVFCAALTKVICDKKCKTNKKFRKMNNYEKIKHTVDLELEKTTLEYENEVLKGTINKVNSEKVVLENMSKKFEVTKKEKTIEEIKETITNMETQEEILNNSLNKKIKRMNVISNLQNDILTNVIALTFATMLYSSLPILLTSTIENYDVVLNQNLIPFMASVIVPTIAVSTYSGIYGYNQNKDIKKVLNELSEEKINENDNTYEVLKSIKNEVNGIVNELSDIKLRLEQEKLNCNNIKENEEMLKDNDKSLNYEDQLFLRVLYGDNDNTLEDNGPKLVKKI